MTKFVLYFTRGNSDLQLILKLVYFGVWTLEYSNQKDTRKRHCHYSKTKFNCSQGDTLHKR